MENKTDIQEDVWKTRQTCSKTRGKQDRHAGRRVENKTDMQEDVWKTRQTCSKEFNSQHTKISFYVVNFY